MLGKACGYKQRTFTRIADDVYSFSGRNHLVVIGNCIVFACHTVEAHRYLTLAIALCRNAEVHFALLAHSSFHAYGTVAFKLHHLLEDEDEGEVADLTVAPAPVDLRITDKPISTVTKSKTTDDSYLESLLAGLDDWDDI
jgi:hypothetical protein